jgi:predicted metal-dependent enzyme (double-stranded beta helix superfamily)
VTANAVPTTRGLATPELQALVRRLSHQVHPLPTLALGHDAEAGERNGMRILCTPDYDVWLLRWPPGTRVTPHDHGDSAGAFVVVEGELIELRWHSSIPECRLVTSGEAVAVARGVVHDVVATNRVAYSIHAYSPPLEAMSFYDVPSPSAQPGWSADAGIPASALTLVGTPGPSPVVGG